MTADGPGWNEVFTREEPGDFTERLAVPGGWLYRCIYFAQAGEESENVTMALVFVPNRLSA